MDDRLARGWAPADISREQKNGPNNTTTTTTSNANANATDSKWVTCEMLMFVFIHLFHCYYRKKYSKVLRSMEDDGYNECYPGYILVIIMIIIY